MLCRTSPNVCIDDDLFSLYLYAHVVVGDYSESSIDGIAHSSQLHLCSSSAAGRAWWDVWHIALWGRRHDDRLLLFPWGTDHRLCFWNRDLTLFGFFGHSLSMPMMVPKTLALSTAWSTWCCARFSRMQDMRCRTCSRDRPASTILPVIWLRWRL